MSFQSGATLTASDLNDATTVLASGRDAVAGTTTSTSYTSSLSGTVPLSVAYVAPASGKIKVTITAAGWSTAGGAHYSVTSFQGSGVAGTITASDDYQIYQGGTVEQNSSRPSVITGLTPGATGVITMVHKVSAGTSTFNHRQIHIEYVN